MITIREARETDVPRVLELYRQLALGPADDGHAADLESSLTAFRDMAVMPGYHLLLAEEDGLALGTIVLVILPGFSHGESSPWSVIEYVVVDEAYRSQGIGQKLMAHAEELAREAGCYKIMLCSNKKRPDAHRFYRRAGYQQTHEAFHRYLR